MDVGHGGQILVSASTHRLLIDDLPIGISLRSLGTHHLKDLYRPEEIFQVETAGLPTDFPPLRLALGDGSGPADRALEAFESRDWQRAFDILEEIGRTSSLTGQQHEMKAASLYWLGNHGAVPEEFEEAHRAYQLEGNPQSAAVMAIWLAEMNTASLSDDLARAWEKRADTLLEGDETSAARGHLLRRLTVRAFDIENNIPKALELIERALQIGVDQDDGSLQTLALLDKGRILIAAGRVDEGLEIMDEAMAAAVAGDVSPVVLGKSYCLILGASKQIGDLNRVRAWSEAAAKFCDENDGSPYPGVCRVYRAQNLWARGEWDIAEKELLTATSQLGVYADVTGEAYYQYGEIRLRAGDEDAAETAFHEALARGREPVPGYARLLAKRGDLSSALEMIESVLSDNNVGQLDRARFLPTLAEFSLENHAVDRADEAVAELRQIADITHSELYGSLAERWAGRVELEKGETGSAIDRLREAARRLAALGVPYEAALAHGDLAMAYHADGNKSMAMMEANAARKEFERLGAVPDADQIGMLVEDLKSS